MEKEEVKSSSEAQKTALDYLREAHEALAEKKPDDRSWRDRLYQIVMTDIEKVMALVRAWGL